MKKLLLMDAGNYSENMKEIRRIGVRAIAFKDDKLLMLMCNDNELKLPGGGQDAGESDLDTLVRETCEETGYHVLRDTAEPFGEIEEKRLSYKEPMIWHQFNRLYFCDVDDNPEACKYTPHEIRLGFHPVWVTIEEALKVNKAMIEAEGKSPLNQREYNSLLLIKEYMDKKKAGLKA